MAGTEVASPVLAANTPHSPREVGSPDSVESADLAKKMDEAAIHDDPAAAMAAAGHEDEHDTHGGGGYTFDTPEDRAQLNAQRAQLWAWIKSMGSNMFREGINLTKISLPVCLFEARSFLERMCTNWEYQDLLQAAADTEDPVDRMRYVVAFAVAGLSRQVSFHKPFNPILGETYQARFPNGVEIFAEQISHHPPVSSWQVTDPNGKFLFYGNGNWTAGIKGNSVRGRQTGVNAIQFKDGTTVTYELPGITVKGVLWGSRCIKYGGEMKFVDKENNLTCELLVDPQPHQGFLSSWFRKKAPGHKPDMVKGTLKRGNTVLDHASGNWLHHFEWECGANKGKSKRLWDMRHSVPMAALPVENPLGSDCRHRNDVKFLREGDQQKSQEWKLTLEEQQRHDRKLRKEGGGYEH